MAITVFSKKPCVQCDATYRKLDKDELEYSIIDTPNDPEAIEFVTKTLGFNQMPVVLSHEGDWRDFVPTPENRNDYWSGFKPDQLGALATCKTLVDA